MMHSRSRGVPAVGRGMGRGLGAGRGQAANRGRGAGVSAAQQLLQKATTQLRGERVPIKPREEDELASYLNSLTQKTVQQSKSVNYEEFGDISISSGADPITPRVRRTPSPAIGAGSKFLKKKPQPDNNDAAAAGAKKTRAAGSTGGGAYGIKTTAVRTNQDDDDDDDDDDEFIGMRVTKSAGAAATRGGAAPKFGSMSAPTSSKRGGFQMSSALNKATALANKITQRSSGSGAPMRRTRSSLVDTSDTDESIGPLLHGAKPGAAKALSRPGSASDTSVGHDGNKFVKKKGEVQEVKAESSVKKATGRQSPAQATAKAKSRNKSPGDRRVSASGSIMRMSSNVYLTSEEESLAEFIQGLSGSDESRGAQKQAKQAPGKRQASKSTSPSPSPNRRSRRQTPSPTPPGRGKQRSAFRRESPVTPVFHRVSSSQESDSIPSEGHEKIMIADSISLDEPLEINLMDANTLGPIMLTTPEPASYSEHTKRSQRSRISPFKKVRSPSPSTKNKSKSNKDKARDKADKKKKGRKDSSIFSSFGIQSVEDLLGSVSDKENTDESEIPTEPIGTKKKQRDHSTSQIVTEINSRATPQRRVSYAYSDDFEPSISERIGEERGRGRLSRQASASSIATQMSDEETGKDYTEDFASETLSVAKDSESDRSSHYRYSDEEMGTSETMSEATPRPSPKRVVMETRSVEIQTAAPAGLNYQWYSQTGVSLLGPSLGLDNVDPTPIAATVISADALETMTAYSPASLVIHDMLKQQIELIKQFAQAHERLYHSLTESNQPDYKYTTLEGTKAFIAKHRKPRLTMKQALKMVAEEMDR